MISNFKFEVALSVFLFVSCSLMGQKYTLVLELDDDTIGYFDPIRVHVKGEYKGPDTVAYAVVSRYFRPYFQFKEAGTDVWKEIAESNITNKYPCVLDLGDPASSYRSRIPYGSQGYNVDHSTYYYPTNGRNSHDFVFTHPGFYDCRLVVRPFYNDTSVVYSNVVRLFVRKYSRRDRRGIKKVLENVPYPRLLFTQSLIKYSGGYIEWMGRLPIMHGRERILRLKSKSIYVDYLKLGVLSMYITDRGFINFPKNIHIGYPKDDLPGYLEIRDAQLKVIKKSRHASFKKIAKFYILDLKALESELIEMGMDPKEAIYGKNNNKKRL